MEISGVVTHVLPIAQGEGKKGPWKKQEYVIQVKAGDYPKSICFNLWGDKIDQFAIKEGENITAEVDVESREYNGKWYTDVKCWKVEKSGGIAPSDGIDTPPPPAAADMPQQSEQVADEEDDLPF